MVTTGREELGSATGGGGGASFRQEECLADPIKCWALIFDMIDCRFFQPLPDAPIYCGQLSVAY